MRARLQSLAFLVVRLSAVAVDFGSKDPTVAESDSCWSSAIPADKCCDPEAVPEQTYGCWGDDPVTNKKVTFAMCCDAESIAYASLIRRRWNSLLSARDSGAVGHLDGCSFDGLNAPTHFLYHFRTESFGRLSVFPWGEVPQLRSTRLRWRIGQVDQMNIVIDRCGSRPELGEDHGRKALPLPVWIYKTLRAKGVALDGWLVNLGAGLTVDPMQEITAYDPNVSAIFVDPRGPRGRIPRAGVRFVEDYANPNNFCSILKQGGLDCSWPGRRAAKIDFLKIDIDSFDCAMARAALREARPKAVWIEINVGVPPPIRFARQWHPDLFENVALSFKWNRFPATMGCSMSAAVALFREEGYGLYGSDGLDIVFVRQDLGEHLNGLGVDEFLCYRQMLESASVVSFISPDLVFDWVYATEKMIEAAPPHDILQRIWCNFTIHDYLLGFAGMPFTLGV